MRVSGGGHARNRALFIISGSERGESWKATRTLVFADLALSLRIPCGDLPQGAGIASQGLHVDENRPISGKLGRSLVRSCGRPIAASQRVSDAFRGMPDPASRREDTRRDGLAL